MLFHGIQKKHLFISKLILKEMINFNDKFLLDLLIKLFVQKMLMYCINFVFILWI